MDTDLRGMRVAFVVANEGVEQVELTAPWQVLEAAHAIPELVAPETSAVRAVQHLDPGERFGVDRRTGEVRYRDFDALVLPGGTMNADQLRTDRHAVHFVHDAVAHGIPTAVIDHTQSTLIDAGAVKGRTITSSPSLRTDLTNAGAQWVDEDVVVDEHGRGPLVSARGLDDLDAFCTTMLRVFGEHAPLAAR